MKKLYIIHGYEACPHDHWFNWLKNEAEQIGFKTDILKMPDSDKPDALKWRQSLEKNIDLDENTFIIAHSLGCIAVLHFLSEQRKSYKIGALILISGFKDKLKTIPQLDDFISKSKFKDFKINALAKHKAFFISSNDSIVLPALSQDLADTLHITPFYIQNAGHFMGSDSYLEFPQLLNTLKTFNLYQES